MGLMMKVVVVRMMMTMVMQRQVQDLKLPQAQNQGIFGEPEMEKLLTAENHVYQYRAASLLAAVADEMSSPSVAWYHGILNV